jgi:hypothetical protein
MIEGAKIDFIVLREGRLGRKQRRGASAKGEISNSER